jgi:hypothetical protein
MRKSRSRFAHGSIATLIAIAVAPALTQCKNLPGGGSAMPGGLPGVPGGGSCPSNVADIAKASWGLDAKLEQRVKGGLYGALSIKDLAAKVEGDVTTACTNLAKDLGATDADLASKDDGPGKKAQAACDAASKLIVTLKAKASATVEVKAKEPRCTASMDAMADCAASCDATVKPGSVNVKCEGGKLSGGCDAECKGTCSVEAGAQCEGSCSGSCSGSCEAGFTGTCGGKCDGKCDGKSSKGAACKGTCEGKCSASASGSCSGSCKGTCSASCDVEAKGKCSGTCTGECSVQMKAPSCTGEVKPPQMSAECQSHCNAQVSAKMECTPASVDVVVVAKGDAEASVKLKTALVKNLPALFTITMGMKGPIEKAAAGVQASIEGLKGTVEGGAQAALKVGPCIAAAVKAQVDATASINVSVHASASASASASGGTG